MHMRCPRPDGGKILGVTDLDARVSQLIAALEHEVSVVEHSIQLVQSELPSYRMVPREQLVVSVRRIVGLGVRAISTGEAPAAEQIWEAEEATLDRLRAGVPIEDVMAAFRVVISGIHDRVVALAAEHGIDHATVLTFTSLLWKLGDTFSARAASAYRRQGVEAAVADQRRRDVWLQGLLAGSLDALQREQGCRAYDLRSSTYHAFCTEAGDELATDWLQRALAGPGKAEAMVVPTEGQLVGIVATMPPAVAGHLVAVGPEEPVERLLESFRLAQDVLAAARLHFRDGVHTAESLGWRLAVPRAADLTDHLRTRLLEPLAGPFGEQIVEALRSYLANERSIPRTAVAMHVHVNTLRYRLARFEELTGRSLQDTDVLIELAWVLYAQPPS